MPTTHDFRLPHDSSSLSRWRVWRGTILRSLYAGVFVGMISGFVTLLIAILTVAIGNTLLHRLHTDLTIAYREIAPAVAVCFAVLVFLGNIVWERTHPLPSRT